MAKETEKKLQDIVIEEKEERLEISKDDISELIKKIKKLEKKTKSLDKKLKAEKEECEKHEKEKNDYIAHLQKERAEFEAILTPIFRTDHVDDTQVMIKYFTENRKDRQ